MSARIGTNQIDDKDPDGKAFVKERVELAKEQPSFWQSYKFMNPVTKKVEPKQMYCERLDETVVCGGVYSKREPCRQDATARLCCLRRLAALQRRRLHRLGAGRPDQHRRRPDPRAGLQMRLPAKRQARRASLEARRGGVDPAMRERKLSRPAHPRHGRQVEKIDKSQENEQLGLV